MPGKLARDSLKTTMLLGLRLIAQAATLLLLTRLLGTAGFGGLAATLSLAILLGLLPNLGAGYVLMNRGAHDTGAALATWRYAWPMTLGLGAIGCLAYVALATIITGAAWVPWQALLFFGLAEVMIAPLSTLLSFSLQARERVPLAQATLTVPLLLRPLAALFCFALPDEQRLPWYAAMHFLAAVIGLIAGWIAATRHLPLDLRAQRPPEGDLREGAAYTTMHLAALAPTELDKVLGARLLLPHEAGIYAALSRVLGIVAVPVIALLTTALPRLIRHRFVGDPSDNRLASLVLGLSLGWGLCCSALLFLSAPWIPRFLGSEFEDARELIPWFALLVPVFCSRQAAAMLLIARASPMRRAAIELSGTALMALVAVIGTSRHGSIGLVVAVATAELFMASLAWFSIRHERRASVQST